MSDKELKEIFDKGLFRGEIKFDEPMSAHTSLKIGGPVEIMVFPEDPQSLKNVLTVAMREGIPFFVFGAGTNLAVRDGGIEGIAVSLKAFNRIEFIQNLRETGMPDLITPNDSAKAVGLFVESGAMLGSLINFARKNGYSGIEALAGIPGTVGGALYMNAGSFGSEIKDVVISIALMQIDGRIIILKKEELKFSYRGIDIPENSIILSANMVFKMDTQQNVASRTDGFMKKKKQSQPLGKASAGCIFKNPEGDYAGKLIEAAGCKGMRKGGAEVSQIHANYFINSGKATCSDFIGLMEAVREKVKKNSGIVLEPEVKIIGKEG